MLAQNQGMLQMIWTIFVIWKNWLKWKTVFFQTWFFQNFTKYKNKIFKQLWKHRVYGYDPLYKHGEISMFLTLSTKYGFGKTCKLEYQKPNRYFVKLKEKFFCKNNLIKSVCIYVLEQSTNYSILYILTKNKIF